MIVTRTPFRVTLGGGGTDLPSFYEKHGGFILAMGLDKYMYVCLNRPIVEKRIILHYTKSESVERASELKHELAREALKLHGIEHSMEISSLADIPASTGLGSSSCYLVGLLTALRAYRKDYASLEKVAEEACRIELEVLKKGIGKQDQYLAAYGGMTALDISRDGKVGVRQLHLSSWAIAELISNCHLYYLARKRDAQEMLDEQNRAMRGPAAQRAGVEESLLNIRDLGHRILKAVEGGDFDGFGRLMDEHWQNKKKLSGKISFQEVDELYEAVKKDFGVLGGKIVGAGGGGFLMLYAPDAKKDLTGFMAGKGSSRLHYGVDFEGSKVVTNLANAVQTAQDHTW
ncbi:MAG: hypothetical protein A2902_06110 [Elusimicrobia bacterium RIFCSPLOWO2_01_FULL_64_13]|nr:MAG: hypothetical protein A2902_06110 [Elusimicrobia bacterium RIFCSPLOWO2_01_FULL_64_13]